MQQSTVHNVSRSVCPPEVVIFWGGEKQCQYSGSKDQRDTSARRDPKTVNEMNTHVERNGYAVGGRGIA
jgi:hypothetical protein